MRLCERTFGLNCHSFHKRWPILSRRWMQAAWCTHCISENGGLRKGGTTTGPSAKQAQSQMRAIDGMQDRCNWKIKFASNWKIGRPVQLSDYIVGLRRKTAQFADFVCTWLKTSSTGRIVDIDSLKWLLNQQCWLFVRMWHQSKLTSCQNLLSPQVGFC